MPEPTVEHDGQLQHPEVRYEHSDVSFRGIMLVGGAIACTGVVIFVVVWLVFYRIAGEQDVEKRSPYPLASEPSRALPREPRLEQIDRLAGVETPNVYLRQSDQMNVLDSYGPTEEEGFIHIPIERAMEMLADKLPARPTPPAEQAQAVRRIARFG